MFISSSKGNSVKKINLLDNICCNISLIKLAAYCPLINLPLGKLLIMHYFVPGEFSKTFFCESINITDFLLRSDYTKIKLIKPDGFLRQ